MTIDTSWGLALNAPAAQRPLVRQETRAMLQQLHSAGFVHGDPRASNVLYKVEGDNIKVMLIDFDEAGRTGQAYYSPLPFNTAIQRSPDVAPGGAITPEQDLWQTETDARFFV